MFNAKFVKQNEAGETATAGTAATINPAFDKNVDSLETKFHFKKVTDEAGNDTKRPTVELKIPVPSVEGIVAILEAGGKGLDLIKEALADVIIARAREIVNEKEDISQENFPFELLNWDAIANLPKAERRGGGIAKELWEEFGKDYQAIMPAATGKSADKIAMAVKVFLQKFAQVKTDKKVIQLLRAQLAIYTTSSPNVENFVDCVEFLDKKAETLLAADSSNLLDALM